jgi:TRAP-type C4-dicarboxylate transport system substrate-binding protein
MPMLRTLILAGVALAAAGMVTARAEPVELRFVSPAPAMGALSRVGLAGWVKDVNEAGKGIVSVRLISGTALADFRNLYDRITNGVADIGFGTVGSFGGQFVKSSVLTLPFQATGPAEGALAYWRLFANGTIADEYKNVKVLALFTFAQSGLHTKEPVHSAADLAGKKMGAEGRLQSSILTALGTTPLSFTPAELYEALNRGTIQGTMITWTGFRAFKLQEVLSHHLIAPFGSALAFVIMNKASWERLPPEAKAVLDKFSGESFSRRMGQVMEQDEADAGRMVEKLPGQTFEKLSPAARQDWITRMQPAIDGWKKDTPDGAHLIQVLQATLEDIRAGR